jgi:hypothetical protein
MAEATLTSPLTLDPQQAVKLRFADATIDFVTRTVFARYELVDNAGAVIAQRTMKLTGAQVQTWITNQENTLYTRLLAQLGVTGTIG